MNKSIIDKYLLEKTSKLLFLPIEEMFLSEINVLNKFKGTEIPLFSNVIYDVLLDKKQGVDNKSLFTSLFYILGIDSSFKYCKKYVEIINNLTNDTPSLASNLASEFYKDKNYLDALIILKGYNSFFESNRLNLYNYALICKEIADISIEKNKKNDFLLESNFTFNQIINLFSDFAEPYYYCASINLYFNDIERAQENFNKAIKLGISEELMKDAKETILKINYNKKLDLAVMHIESLDYDLAFIELNEIILKDTNNYDANFYLGYLYRINEDYEKAIDSYEIAYKLNPTNSNILNELALCFSFLGDFEQAIELLEHAHAMDSSSIEILCNLAMVYYNLNDIEKAKIYIAQAEELDRFDDIVLQCIKLIYCEN